MLIEKETAFGTSRHLVANRAPFGNCWFGLNESLPRLLDEVKVLIGLDHTKYSLPTSRDTQPVFLKDYIAFRETGSGFRTCVLRTQVRGVRVACPWALPYFFHLSSVGREVDQKTLSFDSQHLGLERRC